MSKEAPRIGAITWADLTVPNATEVREFYHHVVGYDVVDLDMGGYSDYCMNVPGTETTVAGVCHARGPNADLPPVWLIYITVADLAESVAKVTALGGKVIREPKSMGEWGSMAVIEDPAGAVAALIEPPKG